MDQPIDHRESILVSSDEEEIDGTKECNRHEVIVARIIYKIEKLKKDRKRMANLVSSLPPSVINMEIVKLNMKIISLQKRLREETTVTRI